MPEICTVNHWLCLWERQNGSETKLFAPHISWIYEQIIFFMKTGGKRDTSIFHFYSNPHSAPYKELKNLKPRKC